MSHALEGNVYFPAIIMCALDDNYCMKSITIYGDGSTDLKTKRYCMEIPKVKQ